MERVGAVIRSLEQGDTFHRRLAETRALESWSEVVGPLLAEKTRPLRVARDRLLVVAHGAALRQELVFHKSAILRKFNACAGMRAASEIVFLESDANLSSLVEANPGKELEPVAPRVTAETASDKAPETEETVRLLVYELFDAAAYRSELDRIAGR